MKTPRFGFIVLMLFLSWSPSATAQELKPIDPHAARVANDVSHDVLSPFCPGKTLAMCPSPAAAEVRMKIQDMATAGMNEDQIKDAIIAEHGEEFRTIEPPWTDDIGLLGALGGGLALALLAVVIISRRRTTAKPGPGAEAATKTEPPADDPYLAELRKQVRD